MVGVEIVLEVTILQEVIVGVEEVLVARPHLHAARIFQYLRAQVVVAVIVAAVAATVVVVAHHAVRAVVRVAVVAVVHKEIKQWKYKVINYFLKLL